MLLFLEFSVHFAVYNVTYPLAVLRWLGKPLVEVILYVFMKLKLVVNWPMCYCMYLLGGTN